MGSLVMTSTSMDVMLRQYMRKSCNIRRKPTQRLKELGLVRKVGSTEARQASLPINLFKREQFWQMPPPFGVNGCERRRLIDIDKCGIELNRTNRKYGRTYSGIRVVKPGHYSCDTKLTLLLAVEAGDLALPAGVRGSVTNPMRWLRILVKAGTTACFPKWPCKRSLRRTSKFFYFHKFHKLQIPQKSFTNCTNFVFVLFLEIGDPQ